MTASNDRSKNALAINACDLYFNQQRTQKDIANHLGVSPATVSRLIRYAKDAGLVEIRFNSQTETDFKGQIERTLSSYGVHDVRVVEGTNLRVGQAAARFYEDCGGSNGTVILDGGLTVQDFVKALLAGTFVGIKVIPICSDPVGFRVSAFESTVNMTAKYNDASLVKLPGTDKGFLEDLKTVRRTACNADFVFLGVGGWHSGSTGLEFVKHLGVCPKTIQETHPQVAAVCGYFAIDRDGRETELTGVLMQRSVTFSGLQQLASNGKCKNVLLASGKQKADAVMAVIRARICNTIIVDDELARALNVLMHRELEFCPASVSD